MSLFVPTPPKAQRRQGGLPPRGGHKALRANRREVANRGCNVLLGGDCSGRGRGESGSRIRACANAPTVGRMSNGENGSSDG